MDLVMNLLLTVVLAQTVICCEESRCVTEKRERGRSPRHITAYVEALERFESDLDVSDDYHDTHDEKADKEQIVLNRIRDQFFSYRDRQSVEAQRKEEDEARKDTLLKLGYTVPPTNLIGKKRLPASSTMEATEKRQLQKREEPHIISLIERHAGQKRRERMKTSQRIDSVNVNKILQIAQSATTAGFGPHNGDACFFERPAEADNYRVTSAAFHVYIHRCSRRRRYQHNSVLVYRIAPSAVYRMDSQADENKELLATKTISRNHVSAWHRFDVTTMVQNWMSLVGSADKDWVVLTVEFSDFDHEVVYPMDTGEQSHLPYLEINVELKRISRQPRSIPSSDSEMEDFYFPADDDSPATTEEECTEATLHCCRRSMKVDSQSVGLRWMISPQPLYVSYCNGQCPATPEDPRLMTPGLAAAIAGRKNTGLCCAPIEYADLDVVYYDDNMQIIFGTLRNFNVVRCGCL